MVSLMFILYFIVKETRLNISSKCYVNGPTSRRFSGQESFSGKIKAHGIDAGTGLGVVLTADDV